jgi:predicted nucleic acid-binding Zn ribbon protein
MTGKRPLVPLGEAIASYFRSAGIVRRIDQASVIEDWAALVGPQIAAVTAPQSVTADGILRVHVASAPWATELGLMTPRILARLNTGRAGRIREIRWVPGPIEPRQPSVNNRKSNDER